MNKYAVIMAGGGGVRFWPLSKSHFPKQYLNITGQDALINETLTRSQTLVPWDKTYIVTNQNQQAVMEQILPPAMPRENILYEPMAKNTAPCVLYAALHIWKKHGDGVMCVFSADPYIADTAAFTETIDKAIHAAADSGLAVVIGIKPTFPSTGYGYIKRGSASQYDGADTLDRFVEKPDAPTAAQYVASGEYLWNSGMFVWKVSTVMELFKRFLPKMYDAFIAETDIAAAYAQIEGISVDYGIMERIGDALVVPGDFGWSDVGSWDTLDAVIPMDELGNVVKGLYVGMDSGGNTVHGNKLIATIGINDLVIVESEDAILICPKTRVQDIRSLVSELKSRGMERFL